MICYFKCCVCVRCYVAVDNLFTGFSILSKVWFFQLLLSPLIVSNSLLSQEYSTPSCPVLQYLLEMLKCLSIEWIMASNHLILCLPLLLLHPVFPIIRLFSNESALHFRWPKYWSFCFSISPTNEYLGLISFRIDWFDLLAVQGTLKSLLQHHSSKASVLLHSAFFTV